jgi:uracil-DNA glycosylase
MGVRERDKGTGKSPAFKDTNFIEDCQKFFLYQIEIQKPKAILVLGKFTAQFLAKTSEQLACWSTIKNFSELDKTNNQVKIGTTFKNNIKSNLVLLTHPSFRPVNISRRAFAQLTGHDAEMEMLNVVLENCRISSKPQY